MTTNLELLKQTLAQAKAAGQAAMPEKVRAMVDVIKVGEHMSVELGRIEQATSLASLDLARGKASAFLSSALIYEDLFVLRSGSYWTSTSTTALPHGAM